MRYYVLLLLLLLAACRDRDAAPARDFTCALFVVSEVFDVERAYVACEDLAGERVFLWWDDFVSAAPEEISSWAWVDEHRLPELWFYDDGSPLPGTPPTER